MWHLLKDLQEKIKLRKQQEICGRCGLLYKKILETCPHCSHVKDYELQRLLKKRANERINLGKGMILGALAIMLLMIFLLF